MGVRILEIKGKRGFFKQGDEILAIGQRQVSDQLDIFFLASGDGADEFTVRREDGRVLKRRLRFSTLEKAAPVFSEMKFINCNSRCIFCFIDQMPRGLRSTLYQKDDDYRLSFLFGNYVTLNNVGEEQLARILEYNLSPIFVSVHSTEKETRKRLFGRPDRKAIMPMLRRLAEGGITVHAQIVLVPGINDGDVLDRTVDDLYSLYPSIRSVAVVPVGLTGHRRGLEKLRKVSRSEARRLVSWAKRKRASFSEEDDDPFVYLADEIYLKSGLPLPEAQEYGDFDQLANGVGMSRIFIDDVLKRAAKLASGNPFKARMAIVTGESGARLIGRYIVPRLRSILPSLQIELIEVKNRLFGRSVTVSGLISGSDILSAVQKSGWSGDCLVLPPNCINHERVLLDDMTPAGIEKETGTKVIVPEAHFLEKRVLNVCRRRSGR